jgi:hypothetical protein
VKSKKKVTQTEPKPGWIPPTSGIVKINVDATVVAAGQLRRLHGAKGACSWEHPH